MKKAICAIAAVVVCLFMLAACNTALPYNAQLYDDACEWIREDFRNENLTRGAMYDNFTVSDDCPAERVFIVKDNVEYEQIFAGGYEQLNISFDVQMLIVYTFTTVYHRDSKLVSLSMEGNELSIQYEMISPGIGVGDASRPFQRWFVVKLDSLEISSVTFERQ